MSDDSSPDDLPPEARPAYEAYLAMSETKQAYFSFMMELDQKYKQGGEVTLAENLKLEQLLQAHDEQVKAFNGAMEDFKNLEESVRHQLIAAMGGSKPGQ